MYSGQKELNNSVSRVMGHSYSCHAGTSMGMEHELRVGKLFRLYFKAYY